MTDLATLKKPAGFRRRSLSFDKDFKDLVPLFEAERGSMVLLSGGDHPEARMQGMALWPFLELSCQETEATLSQGELLLRSPDLLGLLDAVLHACTFPEEREGLPFGLFGFFSYDLKHHVENLPDTVLDDLFLPLYRLFAPRLVLWQKPGEKMLHMKALFLDDEGPAEAEALLDAMEKRMETLSPWPWEKKELPAPGPLLSTFTPPDYHGAVNRIREHILRGEVYQVNLSQRFSVSFPGSACALFLKMFETAPQPFSAFLQAGDFQLASLSPERFLRVEGRKIESHPIKGTRPRGETPEADARLKKELETSEKDGAELAMIVDLVRNDLGRIAVTGSVHVEVAARTEIWPHLFHRVAVVSAVLEEGLGIGDILKATFPPGSVTGCPRIRAMELIDELEPGRRHAYTGALGYLGFDGRLDLNVAIRTVIVRDGKAHYATGGGVVWDSDPEEEYRETLHKAAPFFRALGVKAGEVKMGPAPLIWQDGRFLPLSSCSVPLDSPALRHGRGLFETLRVEAGKALHLEAHVQRLASSVSEVTGKTLPGVRWEHIVARLCKENPEAAARGQLHLLALDQGERMLSLAAVLRPLQLSHTTEGLILSCHPEPFCSPMARHKSLAYVFFARAREEAQKKGADEALIVAPDGRILEGSFSSLLLFSGRRVLVPEGPSLPGITRQQLLCHLKAEGWKVEKKALFMEDLQRGDCLFCCSSLRGPMWVKAVEKVGFNKPEASWFAALRRAIGYPVTAE